MVNLDNKIPDDSDCVPAVSFVTSVLLSGRFRPNSPILPQNRPQIFKFIDSTGSMTRSSEFRRSLKEDLFEKYNTNVDVHL
mgnify:CR=1 FL=1